MKGSEYLDGSSGKDLCPYQRGWPMSSVVTMRGTTVHVILRIACTRRYIFLPL